MDNSSGTLQDSVNFLFFLILYIPFNVFFMVVTAVLFSIINKLLHLHFPTWVLAIGASILIFVVMFAFLDGSSSQGSLGGSVDASLFYIAILVINILIAVLMLTLSGINKLIFSNPSPIPFSFAKPQIIASISYLLITSVFGLLPLLNDASGYVEDIEQEKAVMAMKKAIDTGDIETVSEIYITNSHILDSRLPEEEKSILDYLISQNKLSILHALLKINKELFYQADGWDIKNPESLQILSDVGISPVQLIERLTVYNHADLVKNIVEKYHPEFTYLVSYITQNVLRHNNTDLLDYLIKNGLASDPKQCSETIYRFVEKNDVEAVKILTRKGFPIDTADNRLVRLAVQNNNLPLLEVLFHYPFHIDVYDGMYTDLENVIISGNSRVFDLLLMQSPDIKTLHETRLDGKTNALLIAEKYQKHDMLAKLRIYAAQR